MNKFLVEINFCKTATTTDNYNNYDKGYIRDYAVNNFGETAISSRIIDIYEKVCDK